MPLLLELGAALALCVVLLLMGVGERLSTDSTLDVVLAVKMGNVEGLCWMEIGEEFRL